MNRFSMPPFKLATNVWSAKDAPLQIQSFYAIKKVANLRGGLEKNELPSFKHQNCCHRLKIALSTNFLADSASSSGQNVHTRLICCNVPCQKVTAFRTPHTGGQKT